MCCSRSPGLFFFFFCWVRGGRPLLISGPLNGGRTEGTIHRRIERDLVGGIGTKKMQRRRKKRVCTHIQEEYVHIPSWSRTFLETGSTISLLARPFRFIWTLGSRRRDTTFPFRLSWHSPSLLPRHFLQPPSFSTTSIRAIENVYRSREIWRDRVERFDPRLFRTTPRRKISRRASQLFDWHSVSLSCHHHRSGRSLRIYCRHITAGINDCWLILARLFSNSICPLSVVSGIDRQMDRRLDVRRDEQDAIDSQKHLPISSSGAINKEEKANMQSTGRRLMRRVRLLSGCTVSSACCRLAASLQLLSPPSISSQKVILFVFVFFVPSWCRPLSQSHSPHRFRTLPFEEKRINLSYTGIY